MLAEKFWELKLNIAKVEKYFFKGRRRRKRNPFFFYWGNTIRMPDSYNKHYGPEIEGLEFWNKSLNLTFNRYTNWIQSSCCLQWLGIFECSFQSVKLKTCLLSTVYLDYQQSQFQPRRFPSTTFIYHMQFLAHLSWCLF